MKKLEKARLKAQEDYRALRSRKERLAKSLKDKNVDKMMSAPVTAIIAYDLDFWKDLPYELEIILGSVDRNWAYYGCYFFLITAASICSRMLGLAS